MRAPGNNRGFTLVELLVGITFLMVSLLAIAGMFPMAYVAASEAGKTTMTLTAARQVLEETRALDFSVLVNLNGFDTANPLTLPAGGAERDVARRWRYALAGSGDGFVFTATERSRWASLTTAGGAFGARGRIRVVAQSPTLMRVTITISVPQKPDRTLATLIGRT